MTPADPVPGPIDRETFFSRPDLYPLEFGPGHMDFVPMTPESYRRSIFTDRGRIVPAGPRGWQIGTGQLLAEFERCRPERSPIFFIFHIAHCGSTLLARAVDIPGRTLVIREPFTLRQIGADAAADGGPADRSSWARCLSMTAGLLGRRYGEEQPVIVKANVPVNFMLQPLMDLDARSGGVLLYSGFDSYILSVLKTPRHRRWVGNVSRQLAGGIRATDGLEGVDVAALDAPRAAACLWLSQMARFRSALNTCPRLFSLDCEVLFERPGQVLDKLLESAGAAVGQSEIDAIVGGELFTRHAKDPSRPYGPGERVRELEVLGEQLGPELESARSWAMDTGAWPQAGAELARPLC